MIKNIQSTPFSIDVLYVRYSQNRLVVNRKYQRKLVWTREEKIAFIDSIYRQYSVPLILLSASDDDLSAYQIIDGMQRLNAIFFLEKESSPYL